MAVPAELQTFMDRLLEAAIQLGGEAMAAAVRRAKQETEDELA